MKKKRTKTKDANELRDLNIIQAHASGTKTQSEIADDFGLSRQRVNRILNSEQAKEIVDSVRSQLIEYSGLAMQTLVDAMQARAEDSKSMAIAVQAATTLLKGVGALTEKIKHEVDRPFVMKLLDGSEIHMGHAPEKKEEL